MGRAPPFEALPCIAMFPVVMIVESALDEETAILGLHSGFSESRQQEHVKFTGVSTPGSVNL